jgi:uncharacterized protein YcfJ
MNKRISRLSAMAGIAILGTLPLAAHAQQQEMARVISSTPVMQQVAVPRQVCSNSTVVSQAPKSGAGALMGAIAGGAVGSQIGGGMGNAAATAIGVLGGAILGNRIEGQPVPVAQPVTTCTDQAVYENRVVAYNVSYEYAGKQYAVQMPNDPGPYVPITITPATATPPPAPANVVTTVPPAPVVVAAPPVVVAPPVYSYYGPYYGPAYGPSYGPFYGSGIQFRWSSGGGHHHHHRRW